MTIILRILLFFLAATVFVPFRLLLHLDTTSLHTNTNKRYGILPPRQISHARQRTPSRKSPACQPHWNVALPKHAFVAPNDVTHLNGHPHTLVHLTWNDTLPFSRIYFYHIRKAGGTMIRKYLKRVASKHRIDLTVQEHKYAREDVGSHPHTFYVTNLRDPVERAVSHFKYEGRWDCRQLVKNHSFVANKFNARDFQSWNQTGGFLPSSCQEPFSFHECAVNCYIQSFSGEGCTQDKWQSEYNLAMERLFRYNLVFVYEKFKDPNYIHAIENFFGVDGFNQASDMFCGWQAHAANKRNPLLVRFDHMLELTRLNQMDIQLFQETTWCVGEEYAFPTFEAQKFASHENWTLEE